ncbi:hypothetical protein D1AOALGA4SA_2500 [Olavius algarvensis Delta 1 endosymbiont]|nr:hypothetical protein D1AOALGA4SA_2500 [Olavius algarvensis Delta 1 endosymbiont]
MKECCQLKMTKDVRYLMLEEIILYIFRMIFFVPIKMIEIHN